MSYNGGESNKNVQAHFSSSGLMHLQWHAHADRSVSSKGSIKGCGGHFEREMERDVTLAGGLRIRGMAVSRKLDYRQKMSISI